MTDLDRYRAACPPTDRVPFVLGGRLGVPDRARLAGRALFAVGVVLAVVALPVRGLYRATGSSMEEGFMLVFPRLVQQGKVPNDDFLHLYGPGSLDVLAIWYRIVRRHARERSARSACSSTSAIIFAIYALTRAWGHVAAVGAALAQRRC